MTINNLGLDFVSGYIHAEKKANEKNERYNLVNSADNQTESPETSTFFEKLFKTANSKPTSLKSEITNLDVDNLSPILEKDRKNISFVKDKSSLKNTISNNLPESTIEKLQAESKVIDEMLEKLTLTMGKSTIR